MQNIKQKLRDKSEEKKRYNPTQSLRQKQSDDQCTCRVHKLVCLLREGQKEAEGIKIKKEEKVKDLAKILSQRSLQSDHVVNKKTYRLDQRNQIYMKFKLVLNHLLDSKQRDCGEANTRQRKKKILLLKNSLQGEIFTASITKDRHKFNRDFKMNTTQQNEKAYTNKTISVEVKMLAFICTLFREKEQYSWYNLFVFTNRGLD